MSDYFRLKEIKLTQQQILWIQDWIQRIEEDPELSTEELRRELFRMKKELAASAIDDHPPLPDPAPIHEK